MSSSDLDRRLVDIVENANKISSYISGLDEAGFARDGKTVDATERCLERIAEAVVKIGEARMAEVAPEIPFQRVRGLGNLLRHAYDEVDLRVLFRLLNNEVATLRTLALEALKRS